MSDQHWTMYHFRVLAMTDEDKIKLERIAKEFVSLCRANGITIEQATYPVSGHRRGILHGTGPGPGRE